MDSSEINAILAEIEAAKTRLIEGMQLNMQRVAANMAAKGKRGWLAMDACGAVFLHKSRPRADGEIWVLGGECCHILDTWDRVAAIIWKHSLTPVGEVKK